MKRLHTIIVAIVIAFSRIANAETTLTQNQMDSVNAGGFAFADAIATALGVVNSAFTDTWTSVIATNIVPGEFGAVFVIDSDAHAQAASDSDAKAVAVGSAWGYTQGTLLSDTESYAMTHTDTESLLPSSIAHAGNTSLASSNIIGFIIITKRTTSPNVQCRVKYNSPFFFSRNTQYSISSSFNRFTTYIFVFV